MVIPFDYFYFPMFFGQLGIKLIPIIHQWETKKK